MPDTHYVSALTIKHLETSAMPRWQDARSVKPAGYSKEKAMVKPTASHADPETASIATDQISLEKAEAQADAKTSTWRRLLKKST